jgi:hypothetical protein
MNSKQRKTLERVFARPTLAYIAWADIESLLTALGAVVEEGRGSRVWFYLNGRAANFHRPHPGKEAASGPRRPCASF